MTLEDFNTLDSATARKALFDCCGSGAWADAVVNRRPYRNLSALQNAAEEVWQSLTPSAWIEAFAGHPRIGEPRSSAKWSAAEQSGMSEATDETALAIRTLNEAYEHKFGWIFIVCASGKSAEEMRRLLDMRLQNSSENELPLAAAEQLKIINLRLAKLIAE